jgi:riboflavin kinase/FMN adenylyltransferase
MTGTVVLGRQLGRTINFPTANISIKEEYKLIPKTGVYVVSSVIDGVIVYGMMNIGNNPTVGGKEQTIEVHYFDFNNDLYNRQLQVAVHYKLRDEVKFPSLQDLQLQLELDKKMSLQYIKDKL